MAKKQKTQFNWRINTDNVTSEENAKVIRDYLNQKIDKDFSDIKNLYKSIRGNKKENSKNMQELITSNEKDNSYDSFVYAVSRCNPDAWGILAQSLKHGYGIKQKNDFVTKLTVFLGDMVGSSECTQLKKDYNDFSDVKDLADTCSWNLTLNKKHFASKKDLSWGKAIALTKFIDQSVVQVNKVGYYDVLGTDSLYAGLSKYVEIQAVEITGSDSNCDLM